MLIICIALPGFCNAQNVFLSGIQPGKAVAFSGKGSLILKNNCLSVKWLANKKTIAINEFVAQNNKQVALKGSPMFEPELKDGVVINSADFKISAQPKIIAINNTDNGWVSSYIEHPVPTLDLNGSTVWGIAPEGQMRRGFLYYLQCERAVPYRQMLHYNSWYDISWADRKLTEAGCLDLIKTFGDSLTIKRHLKLNAFLFDDGWDDNQTLWQISKANFPVGFDNMKALANKYHASLGVWMSPWGGYEQAKEQRLQYGRKQNPLLELIRMVSLSPGLFIPAGLKKRRLTLLLNMASRFASPGESSPAFKTNVCANPNLSWGGIKHLFANFSIDHAQLTDTSYLPMTC